MVADLTWVSTNRRNPRLMGDLKKTRVASSVCVL